VRRAVGGAGPFLLFSLVVVALSLILAWRHTPLVAAGGLVDPDGYMRLVRVRLLADGGGWFDSVVARSNWPLGETLHWSRPLDALILVGAWVLSPLAGFERALHFSGVWISSLLLVATFAATAWAAEPVVGRRGRGFAMLILLAQPGVMGYGLPGRADHHALILLCFAVSLGFALRSLAQPTHFGWAAGLGAVAGLGMWVSPEFLLPLALYLGVGMVLWMRRGGALARQQRRWTGVLVLSTAAAVLLERGPGALAVEYDRVSVVHVLVAALAFGVWWALELWQARRGESVSPRARLVGGAAAGVLALLVMALAFPPFFRGPMVEVTDPATRRWLGMVAELQPVIMPVDLRSAALLIANAGSGLLAIAFLGWQAWREPRAAHAGGRLLLGVGMAGCLALALFQVRWVTYVQVLSAPALALLVLRVRDRWGPEAPEVPLPKRRMLARASASAALVAGPLLTAAVLLTVVTTTDVAADQGSDVAGRTSCEPEAVASYLARDPLFADGPRTVAAYTDLGPVILYRTHHRVLATPYHRNERGIRTVQELLYAVDDDRAQELVRASEIDLILLCPGQDRALFSPVLNGERTLYGRLLDGEGPAWVREIALPASVPGTRLFEVVGDR
jgi:asparagine N-glycosylation enzyme membrane subunit Stt3